MWNITKALQIPLDDKIKDIHNIPYTLSYIIRKRIQIDNLNELPREKRPTDDIIWYGTADELDSWLDKVLTNKSVNNKLELVINESEIEG